MPMEPTGLDGEVAWVPPGALTALTPRESDLLRQAGERIFALSRSLAAAEKESSRSSQDLSKALEVLEETRSTRDILSAQVASQLRQIEREFDERAELRRLLASLQVQMQALLSSVIADRRPHGSSQEGKSETQLPTSNRLVSDLTSATRRLMRWSTRPSPRTHGLATKSPRSPDSTPTTGTSG